MNLLNFVFLKWVCYKGFVTNGIIAEVSTLGPIWDQHEIWKQEDGKN